MEGTGICFEELVHICRMCTYKFKGEFERENYFKISKT